MKRLTRKEEIIMEYFWEKGPLFVRELRELYPEPKPQFTTLSTQVRNLEVEGFKYFDNSYIKAISALVKEDRVSVDELKELIDMIEKGK